jgi:hypothetical protein
MLVRPEIIALESKSRGKNDQEVKVISWYTGNGITRRHHHQAVV